MGISPQNKKKVFALAACLSGTIALAGCGFLGGNTPRDSEGKVTQTADSSAFDVKVGDCVLEPLGTVISKITQVPCSSEHALEAYSSAKVADSQEYPGDDEMRKNAEKMCDDAFKDFIGVSYSDSELELNYMHPTAETWKTGDREVVCLVAETGGAKSTGSLKGVAR